MHARYGVWIDKFEYDRIQFNRMLYTQIYNKNIACLIFIEPVFKLSSVTEQLSNAHRETVPNPALDTAKSKALNGKSAFILY